MTVVDLPVYRALIIGEYNNSGYANDLPFTSKNLNGMRNSLSLSSVEGNAYSFTNYFNNPSEATIRSAIQTTFAGAKENDVSLIYIVSHGYNVDSRGGYHFSMPGWSASRPSSYVTSAELMSWIAPINGNVVLILDSCFSGAFVDDCRSQLQAEGNIAVLTAQQGYKSASYYDSSNKANVMEFLTYSFCKGIGFDLHANAASTLAADANRDNKVTVSEAFSYARSETSAQVEEKKNLSGFRVPGLSKPPTASQLRNWGGQTP